jgi:Xaa-Pro aminopeptidase
MFQNFTSAYETAKGPERLLALRSEMRKENVTAYLVPHADEHQNEYLPKRAERLAWLTGFTGSAGFCIATLDKAAVFSDGRYTVQLNEQIDAAAFAAENSVTNPPSKWIEENMGAEDIIAYDPWLMTPSQIETFEKVSQKAKCKLQPCENLIDRIWHDQPAKPMGKVALHDIKYAGKSAKDKIAEIQKLISDKECDFTLLTDPASLAWLFNIRGNDVIHNPLALGYAIVPAEGKPQIFIEEEKLSSEIKAFLSKIATQHEPQDLVSVLQARSAHATVLCDMDRVSVALVNIIEAAKGTIIKGRDPVILPRAMKNQTELEGARNAHIRDGVAMVKFLSWLDGQTPGTITEIDTAKKLETIREENAKAMGSELKEISFDTISAAGPHAALPHYRVNETSNRMLGDGEIYLVDSGGQYNDGTTDITRTITIGEAPQEAITDFTLVLKGHIAIDKARFPKGTRGIDLDVLARNGLWQNGKDYAHGTGHGIGSYMNVHEGPQGIHRRAMEVLQPGMILSNEPGYYIEGHYGIRIENLVIVTELEDIGGNIQTHRFENITWTPMDKRLIDPSLLTQEEKDWVDDYHAKVLEKLSPHLDGEAFDWLKKATARIA